MIFILLGDNDLDQIQQAIDEWETHTCIDFRPARTETNFIFLQNGAGYAPHINVCFALAQFEAKSIILIQ